MLMIEGWQRMSHAAWDKLGDAVMTMIAATRAEDGCIQYAFARDLVDPELIRISEKWRDSDAIEAHMASPHMAAFMAAMATVERQEASLVLYNAEELKRLF